MSAADPQPHPMDYEWGVRFRKEREAHRDRMSEREARGWIRDVSEDFRPGAFVLIRRPIAEWEDVNCDDVTS